MIVSKFSEMFEETSTAIPTATAIILDTSGWIPGIIFFIAAVLLTILVVAKRNKAARFVAIATTIFLVITVVAVPILLLSPLSTLIQAIEEPVDIKEAEQGGDGDAEEAF